MAYPRKLTPEVHDRIVGAIRLGCYRETAAASAGIRSATLREWLKRGARAVAGGKGKKGERIYVELLHAIEQAEAEAEVLDLAKITAAATNDWRAAAWKLARLHPERYGERRSAGAAPPEESEPSAADAPVVRLYPVKENERAR